MSLMPAMTCSAGASRLMSLVPRNSTTWLTPAWENTSRSRRSVPGGLLAGGLRLALVAVLPPIPSLITACATFFSSAKRAAKASSQRSWASSVEQVPSVMESPSATMVLVRPAVLTSIDFSQSIEVVLPVNGLPSSEPDLSPAPLSVRYEVTWALLCWLGCTSVPETNRLTATSCCASTCSATGSLATDAPGATVTESLPAKVSGLTSPAATAAPRTRSPMVALPNATGAVPNVLSRRMRTLSPGTVTRAIMRMVALLILAMPSPCCDVAQAVAQAGPASRGAAAAGSIQADAAARARAINPDFFIALSSRFVARHYVARLASE